MWSAQSDDVVVPGPGFAVGDDSLGEQLLGAEASKGAMVREVGISSALQAHFAMNGEAPQFAHQFDELLKEVVIGKGFLQLVG